MDGRGRPQRTMSPGSDGVGGILRTIAIENYRSIRYLVTELDALTVVTGANGSGKTSFHRALRLLADLVRDQARLLELVRSDGVTAADGVFPFDGPALSRPRR